MQCRLTVNMDNAAFGDNPTEAGYELMRILEECRTRIGLEGVADRSIRDCNGNTVGTVSYHPQRSAAWKDSTPSGVPVFPETRNAR